MRCATTACNYAPSQARKCTPTASKVRQRTTATPHLCTTTCNCAPSQAHKCTPTSVHHHSAQLPHHMQYATINFSPPRSPIPVKTRYAGTGAAELDDDPAPIFFFAARGEGSKTVYVRCALQACVCAPQRATVHHHKLTSAQEHTTAHIFHAACNAQL